MKALRFIVIGLMMLLVSSFALGCSCNDQTDSPYFTINKNQITLLVNQTEVLEAKNSDSEKEITWRSLDETVAIVAEGKVTALSSGETEIRAYADTEYVSCFVKVISNTDNEGLSVSLNKTSTSLYWFKGETVTLNPTIIKNGSINTEIIPSWTTSDESVATISNGLVTAKKRGVAKIVCKIESDGDNAEAVCVVTVKDCIDLIIENEKTDFYSEEAYSFDIKVKKNNEEVASPTCVWQSSDESVATVNAEGILTTVSAGQATLTVDFEGEQKQININVKNLIKINSAEMFVSNMNYQNEWSEYRLVCDIDLSKYFADNPWTGNVFVEFNGHLDGCGYAITGLIRTGTIGESEGLALFGIIGKQAIIENVCFDFDYTTYGRYSNVLGEQMLGLIKNCYFSVSVSNYSGTDAGRVELFGAMTEGKNYSHNPPGKIGEITGCIVDTHNLMSAYSNYGDGNIHDNVIINKNSTYIAGYRSGYGNNAKNTKLKDVFGYPSFSALLNNSNGKFCRVYTEEVSGKQVEKVEFKEYMGEAVYSGWSNSWTFDKAGGKISLCDREITADRFLPRIEKIVYGEYMRTDSVEIKTPKTYVGGVETPLSVTVKIINPQGVDITETSAYSGGTLTLEQAGEYKIEYTATTSAGMIRTLIVNIKVSPKIEMSVNDVVILISGSDASEEIKASVAGEYADNSLTFTTANADIAKINDNKVEFVSTGKTYIAVTHNASGLTKLIEVYCYSKKVSVRTADEFIEACKSAQDTCIVLDSDITIPTSKLISASDNATNKFYVEALACGINGNGYKITYSFNDSASKFCGVFRKIEDTALVANVWFDGDVTFASDYQYAIAERNNGLMVDCLFDLKAAQTGSTGNWQATCPIVRYNAGTMKRVVIRSNITVATTKIRTMPISTNCSGKLIDIAYITSTQNATIGWSTGVYAKTISNASIDNVYLYSSTAKFISGEGTRVTNPTASAYVYENVNRKQYLNWGGVWKIDTDVTMGNNN